MGCHEIDDAIGCFAASNDGDVFDGFVLVNLFGFAWIVPKINNGHLKVLAAFDVYRLLY